MSDVRKCFTCALPLDPRNAFSDCMRCRRPHLFDRTGKRKTPASRRLDRALEALRTKAEADGLNADEVLTTLAEAWVQLRDTRHEATQ